MEIMLLNGLPSIFHGFLNKFEVEDYVMNDTTTYTIIHLRVYQLFPLFSIYTTICKKVYY